MYCKLRLIQLKLLILIGLSSNYSWSQIEAGLLVNVGSVATTSDMNAIINPETGSLIFNIEADAIYFFDGSLWLSNDIKHIPYITTTTPVEVNQSQTEKVIIEGTNFSATTNLTIPGFSGTYAYNVISDRQIELTSIRPTSTGLFNIVVSDNGLDNTAWPNNEVDKLEVITSDGTTAKNAGRTCKAIYDDGYANGDKTYWINPDENDESNAFEARCDMTNGGWTAVEYQYDLPLKHQYYSTNDGWKWLNRNFYLKFTDVQINNIRNASTQAKQEYIGQCKGVIHYLYQTTNYAFAIGFRFHTGFESVSGVSNYNVNIIVSNDGCRANNGTINTTTFTINDLRLPVTNIRSRDNGSYTEHFGSLLTQNPVWFK